ncbi:MAG TPA: VC0807 family protein [Streptosporangiaceae bacterium]|nr:VC0807 family protein [Streptosporangiaceae bacterium]
MRSQERAAAPGGGGLGVALRPLAVDVAVPVGLYYQLRDGFGVSLVLSLAASSVLPAVRSVAGFARQRRVNGLAALMLAVNVAGLAVSFAAGNPRWMIAKDSVVSSVIAVAMLVSAAAGRPLMSAGVKPFLTKGLAGRTAAWDRLAAGSARFRRLEKTYTAIWGSALLADCVARVIGAAVLPVGTMVWLSTVMIAGAIGLAMAVSGAVAAAPMEAMLREAGAEAGAGAVPAAKISIP